MSDKNFKNVSESDHGEGRVIPSLVANYNDFHTSYCIDYLTFSFPFEFRYPLDALLPNDAQYYKLLNVLNQLYLSKETAEDTFSSNGFKFSYKWSVPVEYVGEKDPSTRLSYYLVANDLDIGNIEMSGAPCRDLERRYRANTGCLDVDDLWKELFEKVIDIKGSFSRIDIAFDVFDVPEDHAFIWFYRKICLERSFSSPIGSLKHVIECDDRTDTSDKQILTIGSEKSEIVICIYNKKLEQLKQGKPCEYKSWVRIEIRFKKKRANAFVVGLIKNWDNKTNYCVGLLKHYLQIKEKPKLYDQLEWVPRKIRKNWKTDPFWQNLFEDTEKIKLVHLDDETTLIQKKKQYMNCYLSRFFTSIKNSMSPDAFNLYLDLIASKGISNLKAADIDLINFDRVRNNLKPLSEEDILAVKNQLETSVESGCSNLNNLIEIGNIDAENNKLNDLKSQIDKYEKTKDLNSFVREVKKHVGNNFNTMNKEELTNLISGILMLYK